MNDKVPPLGSLRERVELLRKMTSGGSDGGAVVNYVPLANTWARVHERAGQVSAQADGRLSLATHIVVMRFRKDVAPGDRIVHRGMTLDVESARDMNARRAYLSCACTLTQSVG